MSTSSFLHRVSDLGRRSGRYLGTLARNQFFWIGLIGLVLLGVALFVLVNNLMMPTYTRHDVAVEVPTVVEMPYDEAVALLAAQNLEPERLTQRFNPDLPRDVVVDQNPPASAQVKPGRRVYLTVNTGEVPMVPVPSVEGMSLREAQNQLMASRLKVQETRPDSIPSPYRNTVTRQRPASGDSLAEGGSVTLWYSTGLGERYVRVPDVTGLYIEEAKNVLLERRLRSVVVGETVGRTEDTARDLLVIRQSREPGTQVREGFEVRLFTGTEEELEALREEQADAPAAEDGDNRIDF